MSTPLPRKIIITGTGRAGTTFLVQLLTELGLDTGYRPGAWQRDYDEHCQAGLEKDVEDPEAPRIVKSPHLCDSLRGVLDRGAVTIEHAIIPVRSLDDAALSRIRVGGRGDTPGGLSGTADPTQQRAVLAERFHHLVETLISRDIPHTFLAFPRFARDADYTHEKLRFLLGDMTRENFRAAFARVARPQLIHKFDGAKPVDAGAPARAYVRQRRLKRLRRAARRAAVVAATVALFWLLARRPAPSGSATLLARPTPALATVAAAGTVAFPAASHLHPHPAESSELAAPGRTEEDDPSDNLDVASYSFVR